MILLLIGAGLTTVFRYQKSAFRHVWSYLVISFLKLPVYIVAL